MHFTLGFRRVISHYTHNTALYRIIPTVDLRKYCGAVVKCFIHAVVNRPMYRTVSHGLGPCGFLYILHTLGKPPSKLSENVTQQFIKQADIESIHFA